MAPAPLKVFIADDSNLVADMLTELLAEPGRVEVVGRGESEDQAIDAIRAMRPDVVVLDLQLASGSGTNVIRAVRADRTLAATKLIVTSNHTAPQLKAGCMELGADGYFDKVKELGELAATIRTLAGDKQARGAGSA